MQIQNRSTCKARKVGTSMTMTLPWRLVREWNIQEGDPVVTYQLDKLLVVVPLSHLLEIGEPTLVRQLTEPTSASPP